MLTEPYYRALLEDQTEVISRFLSDGTMVYANEVYCRFFGKTRDSLIGQRWYPVAHPDDIPEIEARLAALSPSSPVGTVENRVFAADGKEYWMQFVNRGFFSPTGKLLEIQSVGRDITATRQALMQLQETEAALRRSDLHMRMAMGAAPMGTWEWNIQTGEIVWSDNLWPLFGLQAGEVPLTFEVFANALHKDDKDKVLAAIQQAVEAHQRYCLSFRLTLPDGRTRWALSHGVVQYDAQGIPQKMYGVDFDITELKLTEAALSESRARVQALLLANEQSREQQRQAIVRDVQEQLGPVLATISRQLAELQQQAGSDTQQKTALSGVLAQVQHARQIAATLCSHLPPATSPFMQLSAREQEVMRGLIAGLSARSIAAQLGVSDKSIATYRRRILDKLGVDSNAALIAMAVSYGLL